MGAGKSTVGRILADRWGVPFVDLDAEIGDIPALFARGGEPAFRAAETTTLARVVAGEGVLALGGGTLTRAENVTLLVGWRVVVLLAELPTLLARIGDGAGRPLAGELPRLLAERRPTWDAVGATVWTDGIAPDLVANRVEALC